MADTRDETSVESFVDQTSSIGNKHSETNKPMTHGIQIVIEETGENQRSVQNIFSFEDLQQQLLRAHQECQRLASELKMTRMERWDFDKNLKDAREMVDHQILLRKIAEKKEKLLEKKIIAARNLLRNDGGKELDNETRKKLKSILKIDVMARLSSSSVSTVEDLHFSSPEDDFNESVIRKDDEKEPKWKRQKIWKKKAKEYTAISSDEENLDPQTPLGKRKTSLGKLKIDFTRADDINPSSPEADVTSGLDSDGVFPNTKLERRHNFSAKTVLKPPEMCTPCGKRICFGKVAQKCRDCHMIAHSGCKKNLTPLLCVPNENKQVAKSSPIASPDRRANWTNPECMNVIETPKTRTPRLYSFSESRPKRTTLPRMLYTPLGHSLTSGFTHL